MISRTTIGSSFAGVVRYQFEGRKQQPSEKQAEVLVAVGVRDMSAVEMTADFNRRRKLNPNLGQAVWHTSLSFNPDDAARLDSELMGRIAEDYVQLMGLDQTQYVIIRHHDQPENQHLHIIANRVGNDGKTIKDGRNFYRSKKALQELIQRYNLTPPQGLRPEKQHPTQLRGVDKTKYEIKEALRTALATAIDGKGLQEQLRAQQITLSVFQTKAGVPVGISFEKDGQPFKGSTIGRAYSLAGIQKQLLVNKQTVQAAQDRRAAQLHAEQTALAILQTPVQDVEDFAKRWAQQGVQIYGTTEQPLVQVVQPAYRVEGISLDEVQPQGTPLIGLVRSVVEETHKRQAQEAEAARQQEVRVVLEQQRQQQATQERQQQEEAALVAKWQEPYYLYSSTLANQNAQAEKDNQVTAAAHEVLMKTPTLATIKQLLAREKAGALEPALTACVQAEQERQRAVQWAEEEQKTLEQLAQSWKSVFFKKSAQESEAAQQKLEILVNPAAWNPVGAPAELQDFARRARLAKTPFKLPELALEKFQKEAKPLTSALKFASRREELGKTPAQVTQYWLEKKWGPLVDKYLPIYEEDFKMGRRKDKPLPRADYIRWAEENERENKKLQAQSEAPKQQRRQGPRH